MNGRTLLRISQVLTRRQHICRAATIATLVGLLITVAIVPHLTTLQRPPDSRINDLNNSDTKIGSWRLRGTVASAGEYRERATTRRTEYLTIQAPPNGHDGREFTTVEDASVRRVEGRIMCQRWTAMDGVEETVRKIFFSTQTANCNRQKRFEICRIEATSPHHNRVACVASFCNGSHGFLLGKTNTSTGLVRWHHLTSQLNLEDELALIIHPIQNEQHFGFCFVRCILQHDLGQYAEQLLLFPVRVVVAQKPLRTDAKFNFNIIWLDSVSRSHFVRSLPKSTNVIRTLRMQTSTNTNATQVFDFQLFQTIRANTLEMLNVLWSGEYSRKNDMFKDEHTGPTQVEMLLAPLKRAGYRTLWLEDACWQYKSDLSLAMAIKHHNLTLVARWQHFVEALERTSIDAVDVSLAMCVLFKSFGITDQFHGPAALCHNGRHVHEYLFDYLHNYQQASSSVPHATFLMTNVAHEDTGRRLQTLDDRLAAYLSFAAVSLPDTVTLVLSDHGNSYGIYPETSLDGRLETYNPVLLMLVPFRVRHHIGRRRLDAFAVNEGRLVSMRDVHLCLRDFISVATGRGRTTPAGLSDYIPANRTCDDLSIDPLAYCVCRDGTAAKPNDDWQALIAEFAIGTLNDVIRTQYQAALPRGASEQKLPQSCHRLVPLMFGNVTETYQKNNHVITKLDVHVSTRLPGKSTEVFVVTVKYSIGLTVTASSLSLVGFDRVTRYSEYESCADRGVDIRLCVCDMQTKPPGRPTTSGGSDVKQTQFLFSFLSSYKFLERLPAVMQRQTIKYAINASAGPPCLYVLCRKYDVGAAFELINVCEATTFAVSFRLTGVNVDTSAAMPATLRLPPRQLRFVSTVRQAVTHRPWNWTYTVDFSIVEQTTHAPHAS